MVETAINIKNCQKLRVMTSLKLSDGSILKVKESLVEVEGAIQDSASPGGWGSINLTELVYSGCGASTLEEDIVLFVNHIISIKEYV